MPEVYTEKDQFGTTYAVVDAEDITTEDAARGSLIIANASDRPRDHASLQEAIAAGRDLLTSHLGQGFSVKQLAEQLNYPNPGLVIHALRRMHTGQGYLVIHTLKAKKKSSQVNTYVFKGFSPTPNKPLSEHHCPGCTCQKSVEVAQA